MMTDTLIKVGRPDMSWGCACYVGW